MTITTREKDIIKRAASALYSISTRANDKMTERRFEKAAEMLDAILYDFDEEEDDAAIAARESVGNNWW
jgi:hypothetical protein